MDVQRYEVMLREGFRARKERRAMEFTPTCQVERVVMSSKDFWKLYKTFGAGEVDYRYSSTELGSEDGD